MGRIAKMASPIDFPETAKVIEVFYTAIQLLRPFINSEQFPLFARTFLTVR